MKKIVSVTAGATFVMVRGGCTARCTATNSFINSEIFPALSNNVS
jgi:hypothetical protein